MDLESTNLEIMKTEINNKVFNNLMQRLNINPAQSNQERFDDWMRNKVKSIHYANNNAMCNAYQRIIN